MPTVTHSVVDAVGNNPTGVRAVEVRLVAPNPTARVYRTSDGAEVRALEQLSMTPTAGAYPTSFSVVLASNDTLTPAGTHYQVRVIGAGDDVRDSAAGAVHHIVVPSGAGPYRLFDCLMTAPVAGGPIVVGFTPAGVYSPSVTYNLRQVVEYQGSSYVARGTSTGVQPGTDPTVWQLVASKGSDGVGVPVSTLDPRFVRGRITNPAGTATPDKRLVVVLDDAGDIDDLIVTTEA